MTTTNPNSGFKPRYEVETGGRRFEVDAANPDAAYQTVQEHLNYEVQYKGHRFEVQGAPSEQAAVDAARKYAAELGPAQDAIRVQTPDGGIAEFPAGTSNEVMERALGTAFAVPKDESYGSALKKSAADYVSGVGKTLKHYVSKDVGQSVQSVGDSWQPKNYRPAMDRLMTPEAEDTKLFGYGVGSIPRAATEGAVGTGVDVTAAMLGGRLAGPFGAKLGGMGSYYLRTLGQEAEGRAEKRSGQAGAEPTAEDKAIAGVSTGAQGALNQLGLNRIVSPARIADVGAKGVAKATGQALGTAGVEGATNAAQDAISQFGQTVATPGGVSVDPRQVGANALVGGTVGGTLAGPRGLRQSIDAVRFRNIDTDVAPMVASRIAEKAEGRAGNPYADYEAVRGTQQDIRTELGEAAKGFSLSPDALNAITRAKSGGKVLKTDVAAIDESVRSLEGAELLKSLIGQHVAVQALLDKGQVNDGSKRFSGGLSETIRNKVTLPRLLGIPSGAGLASALYQGAAAPELFMAGLPAAATAAAVGVGSYGALRGAEKVLGITSPTARFLEKFSDGGAKRPEGFSRTQALARDDAQYREAVEENRTVDRRWNDTYREAGRDNAAYDRVKRLAEAPQLLKRADIAGQAKRDLEAAQAAYAHEKTSSFPEQFAAEKQQQSASPHAAFVSSDYAHIADADAATLIAARDRASGKTIDDFGGYVRAIERKLGSISGALNAVDGAIPKQAADLKELLGSYKGYLQYARTRAEAQRIIDHMRERLPGAVKTINLALGPDWVMSVWRK